MLGNVILVLALLTVPVSIVVSQVVGARVLERDVLWLAGGPVTPAEADVCARYLRRHRMHRVAGGLFGVVLAAVVGVRWWAGTGIGTSQGGPLGDLLFCGVAGVVVGALSAETYRLRLPRDVPTVASLAPRPSLPFRHLVVIAWALVGVGLVVAALGGLAAGDWDGVPGVVAGVLVLALAGVTRAAIARRRRPVLSPRAQELDGRFRGFAAASVAHLEVSVGFLALLWSFRGAPPVSHPALSTLYLTVLLSSLGGAIVFLHRAAPRPPAGWGGATLPRTEPTVPAASA